MGFMTPAGAQRPSRSIKHVWYYNIRFAVFATTIFHGRNVCRYGSMSTSNERRRPMAVDIPTPQTTGSALLPPGTASWRIVLRVRIIMPGERETTDGIVAAPSSRDIALSPPPIRHAEERWVFPSAIRTSYDNMHPPDRPAAPNPRP